MINFNYFSELFKKFLSYLLIAAIFPLLSFAQNGITSHPDWQIKPVINKGFILIHRVSLGHLVKGYPTIYEVNVSKPTLGNKLWHLENNKPDVGVSFQCMDFANPAQLGYALTIAPYVEIPLNKEEKASRLVMRILWGGTYITKPFDIHDNHKNNAIGSHLNAFVQFRWFWHIKLSERLRFEPGISFSHCSNGKTKNPNLGLNVASISVGLNYLLLSSNRPGPVKVDSSGRVKSKNEIIVIGAFGVNERSVDGPLLMSYVLSGSYQRNVRNTHKFSAGMDLFYDQNYIMDYEDEFKQTPTGMEQFRMSARVGYSYNIGRLSLPIEVGYYIYQKGNPDAMVVSRLGVRYYSASGVILSFGLRTHFAVAYTFEYGIGYRLFIK